MKRKKCQVPTPDVDFSGPDGQLGRDGNACKRFFLLLCEVLKNHKIKAAILESVNTREFCTLVSEPQWLKKQCVTV
jgi:hypothetical protein